MSPFLQRQRLLAARPHLKCRVLDFGCGSWAMASLVAADSYLGARVGLFSRHASEEHEQLLDRTRLESLAEKAGLNLVHYRRVLLGANQLAVMKRAP